MLKRKIEKDLVSWKNNHKDNCLLVIGARQIGKTYIIREFAKKNYKNIYELNFIENEDYNKIFAESLDVKTILKNFSLYFADFNIIPGETLIFLDEIQACEEAITALKFLASYSEVDVIASGSMLGIAYKRVKSFPVGFVSRLEMHSLDFEEFCWANGINENAINNLKEYFDNKKQIPDVIHTRMLTILKEYIIVGGMPKVVDEFIQNNNFATVLKLQRNIIDDYRDDILKYSKDDEKMKIRACFDSIPKHLAQDYKKFRYNLIEKKGTSSKYFSSLRWLYDAGIINFCYNLSVPEAPLEANTKDDVFKVYMRDTGLLIAMLDDDTAKEIMNGNLGIYKGAIYENIIADIITKNGKKLYYFEYNSTLEIDFFLKLNSKITAIEVKSADNTKSKSLDSVINNWGVKQGIKLSSKNIGTGKENIINYPLYMAIFLKEDINI